jgi:hypothetical protein
MYTLLHPFRLLPKIATTYQISWSRFFTKKLIVAQKVSNCPFFYVTENPLEDSSQAATVIHARSDEVKSSFIFNPVHFNTILLYVPEFSE